MCVQSVSQQRRMNLSGTIATGNNAVALTRMNLSGTIAIGNNAVALTIRYLVVLLYGHQLTYNGG